MNWQNWLFWGAMATLAQMTFEAASQGLRLTRISLPYMLGTIYTAKRSTAKLLGFATHMLNGLIVTLAYVAIFHYWDEPVWWRGGLIGLAQSLFVLLVLMPLLPEFHPRMASERYGPSSMRQLEPPGFMALNYGPKTPIAIIASHILFGCVIGNFCRMGG